MTEFVASHFMLVIVILLVITFFAGFLCGAILFGRE